MRQRIRPKVPSAPCGRMILEPGRTAALRFHRYPADGFWGWTREINRLGEMKRVGWGMRETDALMERLRLPGASREFR